MCVYYCLKSVAYICLDYIIILHRQERNEMKKKNRRSAAHGSLVTLAFVGRRNEQIQ